ncbi:MAG TPA: hypothetical protein DET40_23440 [Lentisphaeria bacterium]|nr:MAG: hypothetical protein A2X45_24485 [Lentisphaerae bacterium GWF2_50_93]HCE46510.1 hypothetical protein [Lentisphaeria bacterium]
MPDWPHSPPHRTIESGTYMVTSGTYGKVPYFSKPEQRDFLLEKLFEYARLKYVHNNPVHHGVVPVAENYTWCSAGWFNMHGEAAFKKTVESFKTDSLKVFDDF